MVKVSQLPSVSNTQKAQGAKSTKLPAPLGNVKTPGGGKYSQDVLTMLVKLGVDVEMLTRKNAALKNENQAQKMENLGLRDTIKNLKAQLNEVNSKKNEKIDESKLHEHRQVIFTSRFLDSRYSDYNNIAQKIKDEMNKGLTMDSPEIVKARPHDSFGPMWKLNVEGRADRVIEFKEKFQKGIGQTGKDAIVKDK